MLASTYNVMISQTAKMFCRLVSTIAFLSMAGCASQPAPHVSTPTGPAKQKVAPNSANAAVSIAMQQVGVPYRYGGATPQGFDCSGLVYYSYGRVGKSLPRTTAGLWTSMRPVAKDDLQVGDILFFRISGKMSHVGLYVGRNQFVHAPSSGKVVTVGSLSSPFYDDAFIRAGRPN